MASTFNVVYKGLKDGVGTAEFIDSFCSTFGISQGKAEKIASASTEVIIKKELEEERAAKYIKALEACGAIAYAKENPPAAADNGLSLEPIEGEESEQAAENDTVERVCPKCGSSNIEADECLDCGIYISKYLSNLEHNPVIETASDEGADGVAFDSEPTRQMDTNPYAPPEADLIESTGSTEPQPEKVPVGSGTDWLGRSYWHFKQNPFAWIGAIIVFIILYMVLSLIPFFGALAISLLSPVVMAGFSMGAQEQDNGGDFRVGHIFSGFSRNFGQLVLVGVLYLLFIILIGAVFGGIIAATMAGAGSMDPSAGPAVIMNSMGPAMIIFLLLGFILMLFVFMAYYYAPVLVALDDMTAVSAMKMSLKGSLKNLLALIIFWILSSLLMIVAMIPVLLGLLVVIPMLQASVYVSYRDIFHQQDN